MVEIGKKEARTSVTLHLRDADKVEFDMARYWEKMHGKTINEYTDELMAYLRDTKFKEARKHFK